MKTRVIVDKTQNLFSNENGPSCNISEKTVNFSKILYTNEGQCNSRNFVTAVVGITPVWSAWYLRQTKATHVCTLNFKCMTKRKCQHLTDRSNSKT